MSKLKVSIKKSTVTAMMKAGRKERINETELSQLARIKPCGIMHVTKTKKDSVIYTCPANINLTDRLKKAVSKYDFFFMIEQIVIMVEDVYNNGLNVNSVRFNMDDVYINEMTKEMYFIYFPIVGGQESADIVGFIENIIYTMTPVINEDTNYISRFMYYVRSFHGFNGNAIEKYISREERAVVNVLKNKAVTMQQQIMQQQMKQQQKKQMLNNIKNKRLVEIYRKKKEYKRQTEKTNENVGNDIASSESEYKGTNPVDTSDVEELASQYGNYAFYSVRFEDGLYDVCIVDYSEKRVYYFWMTIGFLVCSFIFMMFVMIYNGRVVKRVRRLTREVSRIKKNDINATITKSGNDEIYVLADNIDSMRNSIIQQMSKEKEAWKANRDLVTAMAHDIRTPLTVLNGYLDLLETSQFDSEEEYKQYVDICVDKAGQLKDLSDKLFRYFFVYSGHTDELKMEKFPAKEFFQQMIGEYMCLLEEKGITFQIKAEDNSPKIQIDAPYLKRLFDNIFMNIRKYSDYSKPVDIKYSTSDTKVTLVISNHISKNRNEAESTRIGIKTCEKIAQEMNIDFSVKEKKGQYTVILVFAIVE